MVTLSFGRLRFRPECVVIWGVQGLHGLMFLILISRRLAFPANIWVPYGLPIWGVQPGSVWGSHIGVFVDLILYVQSTIFQLYRDESSWI